MQIHTTRPIMRGDIYYARLTSTIGAEQGGIRPVLIIQSDIGNRTNPTVITAAITGHNSEKLRLTHEQLSGADCGLFRSSTVLLEHLRTLDKSRLGEFMGNIGADKLREVDAALRLSVGLENL